MLIFIFLKKDKIFKQIVFKKIEKEIVISNHFFLPYLMNTK